MNMNRIGAAIVGFLCMAAVVRAVDGDHKAAEPKEPVKFIPIEGGKFSMGTGESFYRMGPAHAVEVKTFELSETLVTVEQYAECVLDGACAPPPASASYCNWALRRTGEEWRRQPMNCASWGDAQAFAKFKSARLPSEAEYEFAATSRGLFHPYPWGEDDAPGEKAVVYGGDGRGYGSGGFVGTRPVCSMRAGNTKQGLCDMVGDVNEWMQDSWHDTYEGAPSDGLAWEGADHERVLRGGALWYKGVGLRVDLRRPGDPDDHDGAVGFRLAK